VARLGRIRTELSQVLPDTQVIEFASQAVTRAETRQRAAVEAWSAIAREQENRARLRRQRESLAAILTPGLVLGAALWLGTLCFNNVRDRRAELGLLRALGLRTRQILALFLSRAALIGLAGACLGYGAGLLFGALWQESPAAPRVAALAPDAKLAIAVLLAAPLVAVLAGWLPACLAAQQDPAVALKER
jgi:putative ABC transport system permease protein